MILCVGDSEAAGRGVAPLPPGYPPAPGSVWMERDSDIVPLAEPTGDDGNPGLGTSPCGFAAAAHAAATGRKLIVVNAGRGGARSDQWLPNAGTGYYEDARERVLRALAQTGAYLLACVQFDGLNDARLDDRAPVWRDNWAAVWAALFAELGATAPIYGIRYPATVPTGVPYPSHAAIRAEYLTAPWFGGVADAPEGPWVEPEQTHLDTDGNVAAGVAVAALF